MCFSHRGKNEIHLRQDFLHTAQQLKQPLEVLPWRQGGLPCPYLKGSFSCCNFLVSSAAQSLADKPADKQLSRKIRWLSQSLNDLRGARCTYEGSGEWDIPVTAFKDWSATNVEPKQHPPKPVPSVLERDPGLWKVSGTFTVTAVLGLPLSMSPCVVALIRAMEQSSGRTAAPRAPDLQGLHWRSRVLKWNILNLSPARWYWDASSKIMDYT